jgi:hypothetical protein
MDTIVKEGTFGAQTRLKTQNDLDVNIEYDYHESNIKITAMWAELPKPSGQNEEVNIFNAYDSEYIESLEEELKMLHVETFKTK